MFRGKIYVSILLGIAFLAGILAPVPECYVTRLTCPVKKNLASISHASNSTTLVSPPLPCCTKHESFSVLSAKCPLAALKPWMKSYSPDLETIEIPILHVVLIPRIFDEHQWLSTVTFFIDRGIQYPIPPPIPIRLQKESFLI